VKLDVYRSCSHQEKRAVLETFWRANDHSSTRIRAAALQYGPFAIISLAAVAVAELAVVIAVSLHRAPVVGWLAFTLEVIVLLSLWWSIG
jgi:hypothetical protein